MSKLSDIEADWDNRAMSASVDAAKALLGEGINGRAMISSLSNIEWGWIVAACVFAWIGTKAKQAVAEGRGYDETIRSMPGKNPEPWEAGAVETILPALGEINLPWEKPVGEWPKETIVAFAWQIHGLVAGALEDRNEGARDTITKRLEAGERQFSAANGGPLMTRKEMDDDIPF
jgi:hypothetical protein